MAELVHSAQNFMNTEDAIIATKRKRAERMEAHLARHSEQGPHPKKGRTEDKKERDNKKTGLSSRRSQNYTPLGAACRYHHVTNSGGIIPTTDN